MTERRSRHVLALAVLIGAGIAALATSPGPPSINRDVIGHSWVAPDRPTSIDYAIRVDYRGARLVRTVALTLDSASVDEPAANKVVEARLVRASDLPSAGPWQSLPATLEIAASSCSPQDDCLGGELCLASDPCEFVGILELRALDITDPVIVPWQVSLYITFEYSAQPADDWVSADLIARDPSMGISELGLAGALGGSVLGLALIGLLGGVRGSLSSVRVAELVASAVLVGLAVVSLRAPGHWPGAAFLVVLGLVIGFVAILRPPARSPRATTTAMGLLLVATVLGALHQTAIVYPFEAVSLATLAGAVFGIGLGGIFGPLDWWRQRLGTSDFRTGSIATVVLLSALMFAALTASAGGAVFAASIALLAAWGLLAYREWTERRSNVPRVAGVVIAALAGAVMLLLLALASPLFRPPPAIATILTAAVAVISLGYAVVVRPRDFARVDAAQTDEQLLAGRSGLRWLVVIATGTTTTVLMAVWSALVLLGFTPFPFWYGLISGLLAILLGVGLRRWRRGEATLLRSDSLALLPFALFGAAGSTEVLVVQSLFGSGEPAETTAVIQVALVSLALIGMAGALLAAIGSPPREHREGIDWTA